MEEKRMVTANRSVLAGVAFVIAIFWAVSGIAQAQTCNTMTPTTACCIVNGIGPVDCIGNASPDIISVHTNCFDQDVVIVGLGGNDKIRGGNGNDTICGCADGCTPADGDDKGPNGNSIGDHIIGGDGDDTIYGGGLGATATGNDRLFGSKGCDTVEGQDGDDNLWGGPNDLGCFDILCGGDDNDTLKGQAGPDKLSGGPNTGLPPRRIDRCYGDSPPSRQDPSEPDVCDNDPDDCEIEKGCSPGPVPECA